MGCSKTRTTSRRSWRAIRAQADPLRNSSSRSSIGWLLDGRHYVTGETKPVDGEGPKQEYQTGDTASAGAMGSGDEIPHKHEAPRATRYHLHGTKSGRLRRRMLLAPVPGPRLGSEAEPRVLADEARHQCRAGSTSVAEADPGWLACPAVLGTRDRSVPRKSCRTCLFRRQISGIVIGDRSPQSGSAHGTR